MTRDERVLKLTDICRTHGRPNNQYYFLGLAVNESTDGETYNSWWFEFIDDDCRVQICVDGLGNIFKRRITRLEKQHDGGYLELGSRVDYGHFPQYDARIDDKIEELFNHYQGARND